ncbi:hypothetical protein MYX64_05360 [Nitrospinae bacterium AH_259_B05_G02_I21]|nr:hypothetical protein [Nitrospinae bacterium AH_259_B05_G02_I21]MDA2931712.1 hypothetical protein [Nitrospinae bacterium AH-259-F20]
MVDPANDHLRRREIAELVGITERQLYKYLRDEGLWFEARELRRAARAEWLCKTDTALFDKAIEGDVAAARLVYQRWDGLGQPAQVVNIDLVSNFIKKLTVSLLDELAGELGCQDKAASLVKRVLAKCSDVLGNPMNSGNFG